MPFLLAVGLPNPASAQSPAPLAIVPNAPDRVLATINGQKFTQADFDRLVSGMTPELRKAALQQPRALLEQLATFQILLADAEKSKLAERSPYREQLADSRRQILVQAQLHELSKAVSIEPEQIKKQYDENRTRYTEAKAKVLFISGISKESGLDGGNAKVREPEESAKLAHQLVAKLKAGEDFAKLAKQFSDDGTTAETGADYPDVIRGTSAGIPQKMRDAILEAEPGALLGPFEHETGFYIFRVESVSRKSFDEASKEILEELKQAHVQQQLDAARARATVQIESAVPPTAPSSNP